MAATRSQLVLLTALGGLVLCAALSPIPVSATEESAETADDGTITTVLQPGWNMVGWLGGDTDASELLDQVPNLERVSAWDAENQRYQRRTRTSIALHGLRELTPGRGLWLEISGDEPVEWTRPASEDSMLLELHDGRNLVGWAGRDGTPIEDAIERFGDTFVHASFWDSSAKRYLHYHPDREFTNPLEKLNHGDALWVELTDDARWWQSGAAPPPVEFFGEFTEEERAEIGSWADTARAVYAERWALEGPITFYVGDLESIAPAYRRIRNSNPDMTSCGNYGGDVIFIWGACNRETAFAHEYFHAIQHDLGGSHWRMTPEWMLEGAAEYAEVVHRARSRTGLSLAGELQHKRAWITSSLVQHDPPSLSGIKTFEAFHSLPAALGYRLGFLAVDWLVERFGEQSMLDFFAALPGVQRWQEAFEPAFGMTSDDFEKQFAAYRAEVAPPLPHLTDDSDEPVLVFVGDIPTDTEAAVRAEFDEVQNYFRQRLGGGTADYTLYIGVGRDGVVDAHRRVFGGDPSERFCERSSHPGFAVINLGCSGAAPYRLDAHHFVEIRERLAPVASIPSTPAGFDTRGPVWLRNGAQWYVQRAYRLARGLEDVDTSRNREAHRAVQTARLLGGTSTWSGYNENPLASRGLAFLALEWLAERAGDPAIFEYYRALTESETWEEAFEAAFDIAVEDFYEAFEVYRAQVAPPFPHLTDNSNEPVLMFIGDVPADTRSAVGDEFAKLQRFYKEELGAGTADYTMLIATDSASARKAHQLLYGDAHDRYCSTWLYRAAGIVNLGCGATVWAYGLHDPHFVHVRDHLVPLSSRPLDPDGQRTRGPAWLDGAAAPYMEYRYVDAAGHRAYESFRNTEVQRAERISRPLSSMVTPDGFSGADYWEARGVAILAVEWLTDRAGDPAIFEYYRALTESETWEEAFEAAFDIAVDDFYEEFEAYRAEIAPPAS